MKKPLYESDVFCGARDKSSPRVCDRAPAHEGAHDDSTLPTGEINRTGSNQAIQYWKAQNSEPEQPPCEASGTQLLSELRADGWMVAVHNDYRLHGDFFTFWLLTKGDRFIKGEGRTDGEALQLALASR